MKWLKALGGMLVISLLFASCIKVDGEVVINDDGSGDVIFIAAVDEDAIKDTFGELATEFGDICEDFADDNDIEDVPTGAIDPSVNPYDEDGFCGSRIEYSLAPSLDHSANMSELFDENTRLYKDGDNWFYESDFVAASEITSGADEFEGFGDVDALFDGASFRIVIDLPGRAVPGQNNATTVCEDGRFIWELDLANPPSDLFAETEPGTGGGESCSGSGPGGSGGGGGLLRVLGLLIVLGLLGAGVWWFLKNRGGDSAATTGDLGVAPIAGGVQDGPGYTAPPLATGPPVTGAAPGAATPGVSFPTADASRETVVMSSEEAQRLAAQARGQVASGPDAVGGVAGAAGAVAGAASGAAGAAAGGLDDVASGAAGAAASADPVWDEALGAWVLDHPTRGRLRHDPASDTWNPI